MLFFAGALRESGLICWEGSALTLDTKMDGIFWEVFSCLNSFLLTFCCVLYSLIEVLL